ncbi:hypothetical protein [Acholeplasma laidlawii]|nr:hypothetical protein [Acholeplasma laidlawii]OAN19842.1 hypothetical protein A2I99_04385 [Acholeplasma laidlawii]
MFPSSPNIRLTLLKIKLSKDEIGNQGYGFISKKEVIGISKSVTSKEYYESKKNEYKVDMALKIQSFLYDGSKYAIIDDLIYQIERTYLQGQFLELYLMETK